MFTLNIATLTTRPMVNAAVATVVNIVITLQLDVDQLEQMFDDSVLAMIDKGDDTHLGVYAIGLMQGHVHRIYDDHCDQVARVTVASAGRPNQVQVCSVRPGHPVLAHYQTVGGTGRTVEFAHAWTGSKGKVLFTPWQRSLEAYL